MHTIRRDPDAFVAPESASNRYRHIRFLSQADAPASMAAGAAAPKRRSPAASPRRSRRESIDPEARRFLYSILKRARRRSLLLPTDAAGAEASGVSPRTPRPEPLGGLGAAPAGTGANGPRGLALMIGVTQFFREPEVFASLETMVLPKLASRGKGLRIWSVGCADGASCIRWRCFSARCGLLERSTLWARTAAPTPSARLGRVGLIPPGSLA